MAQLSINISREFGSTIEVQGPTDECEMLSITVQTNLDPDVFYSRDCLNIHGSIDDLRSLAEQIISVIPAKVEAA